MKVNQKGMDALHRPSFFQSLNSKMSCPINDLLQSIGYTMSRLGFPKAHRGKRVPRSIPMRSFLWRMHVQKGRIANNLFRGRK